MTVRTNVAVSSAKAVGLTCDYRENPLGIDEVRPFLSWRMEDARRGARQTAYEIRSASARERLTTKPDLWCSKEVLTDRSLDVPYGGRKLGSRQRVWWQVRVWDGEGSVSEWSEVAFFELGLLTKGDWQGGWIGRPLEGRDGSQPCPFLRREFCLRGDVQQARVYVTSRGSFELHLNGQRVGQDYFTPGWTDYKKRIPYRVYDVTAQLKAGPNALGAILGDGWYAGYYVGWAGTRNLYGDQLSFLLQVEVQYADGSREVIASGPDWKTSFGPLLASDHYNGETYDARRELTGWDQAGYDDRLWPAAVLFDPPAAGVVAKRNLPARRLEELSVVAQTEPQFGVHVFDLGQNMVGWARIRVRGQAGDRVQIRFAEMLKADGTLYTENLRSARATDVYICRGGGEEIYEPRFTFHGFRYVELTGLREKPQPADVTGVVVYTELPPTGTFSCSNPLVNQLQSNINWGLKGNFLEVPTDCPQRDERLGWTGDAQVFMPTACFNRDVAAFFDKWCLDIEDAQRPDGAYPHIIPGIVENNGPSTGWSDAGVICPWTLHVWYGDTRVPARMFDSMARWVDFHHRVSKNGVSHAGGFGDWLALDMQEGRCDRTPTPIDLISTAYFARVTDLLVRMAKVLGRETDAKKYGQLLAKVRAAFKHEFVTPAGRVLADTQTAYVLALGFDLLPVQVRARAVDRLVELIANRGWRLTTGFLGTPLLAPVLSRFGRTDVAYKLLLQDQYPSWLYSIHQGATTMWERWNSYTKERGFGPVDMNSFNHYAYGCIGEWMYSVIAGLAIDPLQPAGKHMTIHPQPGGGLTWARGSFMSRYGRHACEWALEGETLVVDVAVPANTTATVVLPGRKPQKVVAGQYNYRVPMSPAKKGLFRTGSRAQRD